MIINGLVVPGITDENTLACLSRATRSYGQYCRAVENALAHKCPFCEIDHEYNKVFVETPNWRVWPCQPPEKNTRLHFLIVPKRHIKGMGELTESEEEGFFMVMRSVKQMHNITSCGILIRDGDARLSAGTIEHLHIHLMVPDGTGRVESPFYKGEEAEKESLARAIIFEKLRQGTPYDQLREEERGLVMGRI